MNLRDKVKAAILADLTDRIWWSSSRSAEELADTLTTTAFEAMGGARPCVTCGKGIGPAKVERGYVQCYGCTYPE